MTNTIASPSMIKKTGEWGAQVKGRRADFTDAGDTVTVSTRAGKTWTAVVDTVVFRRKGVVIFTTKTEPRKQTSTHTHSHSAPGRCVECGEKIERWMDGYTHGMCHDCF